MKNAYVENIPHENHSEILWFMRRHNASVYDVTGKEARNWR